MARKYEEQKAKPSNDAYTGMLVVSFAALLVGCGLLYLDYSQYDPKTPQKLSRDDKSKFPTPESDPKKPKAEPDEKDTPPDDGKDTKDMKDMKDNKDADKKDTDKKDTEKN